MGSDRELDARIAEIRTHLANEILTVAVLFGPEGALEAVDRIGDRLESLAVTLHDLINRDGCVIDLEDEG